MTAEAWVAVAIFVLTQFGALGVTVFILKGDTNILRVQMHDMQEAMKSLQRVLLEQALQNQRIQEISDRQLLSGQRLDKLTERLNRFVDIRVFPVLAAERDRDGN